MHSVTHCRTASWLDRLLCQYAHCFVLFTWIVVAATGLPIDGDSGNISHNMIEYRLPDTAVPIHYDIKLIPHNILEKDIDNFTLYGESSTVVQVRRPTNTLYLHAQQLTIDEAATKLVGNGSIYVPTAYDNDNVTQILAIKFESDLSSGEYTLRLKFLTNNEDSFYVETYDLGKTEWMIVPYFIADSARRAFPCWDEPALKATFKISIKHKRNYTALSNMPIREQTNDGSMVWTHFETTPIMSTYSFEFIVMPNLVRIPNEDGTNNVWYRLPHVPNAKYVQHVQEIAERSKQLLTKYTNSTVKVPKIDHVVMSLISYTRNMDSWGLSFYDDDPMFTDYQEYIISKIMRKQAVAYAMAHQWFGTTVSPSWWSQMWVNDGLANFFSKYVMNQMDEVLRATEFFVIDKYRVFTLINIKALHKDITEDMKPITLLYKDIKTHEEIISVLESNNEKVSSILRMLYHILSGDVFQKGIIKYLNAHQFSSATSDDLWSAMQEALDESDVPHGDYNVKEVMDSWIQQRHYPVVYVTQNYENGDVILTQKPFRSRNNLFHVNDEKWWIPITFATRSSPDFSNTVPTHWLKPQDENLVIKGIDLDDWIIVNLQETGYYRVQYDFPSWYKIADSLNSEDYGKIHVLNRAQILDDFSHLMAHPSDLVKFQELANYLHRETDFIAWSPIFEFVRNTKDFDEFPDTHSLKVHLVKLMNSFVKHVGLDDDPAEDDFTKLARFLTLSTACDFGNIECTKMIQNISEENPYFQNVPPNYFWVFTDSSHRICKIDECIDELDSTFLQKRWSEKPDIFINLLNASVSDDTLPDGEYNAIYDTIVQKHANNDSVLDYLLTNINKTTTRGYTTGQILEKIINNIDPTKFLCKSRI